MNSPNLALWLYVAIIMVQVMFSKKWQTLWSTILTAKDQKVADTSSAGGGGGTHSL